MTYLKAPMPGDTEPGIHILLVGVTDYFHLPGGKLTPFELGAGFDVLDAPDFSCKAVADWFLEKLAHPSLPLKSVEMLASNVRRQGVALDRPTFSNVRGAINRWHDLGNLSEENLLIFYFCGHGLQDGFTTHSLLCADFGLNKNDPFEHAVHYEGLESGMRACAARKQVYLLDICRRQEPEISRGFRGPGSSIITRVAPPDAADVAQSVIWATSGGAEAWSRHRRPSVFAEAFVKAFEGGAAVSDPYMPGAFANAASIRAATAAWIKARGEVAQEPQVSQPAGQSFLLHKFSSVKVPVFVRCSPIHRTSDADFSCWSGGQRLRSSKAGRPANYWQIDLPNGNYTFKAKLPGSIGEASSLVFPPLMPVFIDV